VGGACEYHLRVPARSPAAARRTARDAAAIALGGSVAQDRAALDRGYLPVDARTGRLFPLFAGGGEDDERMALRFARGLYRDRDARRAFLGRMRGSTERLLARPGSWAAVERLARTLLRKRTIPGERAAVVVARALASAGRRRPPWPAAGSSAPHPAGSAARVLRSTGR
jgi:hypothetical protein